MKMKLFTLAAALLAVTSFSFAAPASSGEPSTMTINLSRKYTSLDLRGDIKVVLTNDAADKLTITGDKGDVKKIRASVSRGTLSVWSTDGSSSKKDVTIYVPAGWLDLVIINGDAELETKEALRNNELTVEVNGECKVNIRSLGKVTMKNSDEFVFIRN